MDFANQVVCITGSSRGLGAAFAKCLYEVGATVALNSTGNNDVGDQLAQDLGERAKHFATPVQEGSLLIEQVVEEFGRIDAVVHNAGFVRDKTLKKMNDQQWQEVVDVHLTSAFRLTRAAWRHFEKQASGRLVFISSASGLYGNFGQGNYAAAKSGMQGLSRSIALEGAALNIHCNCVAPFGATEMNSANLTDEMRSIARAELIAPLIGYLCHPSCTENGSLFEASSGVFKKVRWERSAGLRVSPDAPVSIDTIADRWEEVVSFESSEHPIDMRDSLGKMWQSQLR